VLEIPEEEALFTIQERESAGRYGPPKVDEYDLLDSDEDELIAEFTETIKYLYEELVDLGYLSYENGAFRPTIGFAVPACPFFAWSSWNTRTQPWSVKIMEVTER
jgi:hypothetical protein